MTFGITLVEKVELTYYTKEKIEVEKNSNDSQRVITCQPSTETETFLSG